MNQQQSPDFSAVELTDMEPEQAIGSLIRQAADMKASDLFFLSNEHQMTISVRHWGTVRQLATVPRDVGQHYISSIKARAGMDIAERRRPLDGRWIYVHGQSKIDLRINSIATLFGEDLTLRLLDRISSLSSVDGLGMRQEDLGNLTAQLSSPSGLILVTGPTGTGKTTTLYACLEYLNNGQRKINTLEDPIEYSLEGVRQSQIHPKIGLDFAELLRNILRQAPDVIMIGEIRDLETAATTVRAANSGHLVFATLHAPVAAGAIQSMLALGVHPHFLASCLICVVSQRLLRTLCPACRISYDLSEAPRTFQEIQSLLEPGQGNVFYGPGGCEQCFQDGYVGRSGVFEVMTFNRELRNLVAEARPTREIQQKAVENGMVEFRRAALLKVAQGTTCTEEILRTVPTEYLGIED